MSTIYSKLIGISLGVFLFILTGIHSQIFSLIGGENFIVDGNYEFTKVMLFNIVSPVFFFIVFLFGALGKYRINISKNIIISLVLFYIIIIFSTYIGAIPFQSVFGGVDKGHGFIFWNNIILFFLSMYTLFHNISEKYSLHSILVSTIFLSLYGIFEFYTPSFEYGDLGNRLLSSFGHPNYVAGVLLMVIPYSIHLLKTSSTLGSNIIQKVIYCLITLLLIFTLLLTKSAIAVFICICYIFYILFGENNKTYYFYSLLLVIIIGSIFISKYFPEKLSSFISRIYIWETTLKIIFSDIKIFFFGIGTENLILYFDNFKVTELYLYENIGFNADRPHNIFLNFWVHFGIFGLLFISSICYKIISSFSPKNWWSYSLMGALIFWSFNFPNIIGYLFFIIIFCYSLTGNTNNTSRFIGKIKNKIPIVLMIILYTTSIIGSYYSYKIYRAETLVTQDKYTEALEIFPYNPDYYYNSYKLEEGLKIENNFYSENYYLYTIYFSFEKNDSCKVLVKHYPSVENYFYCGQVVENKFGLEKAKYFYEKGIQKFPDVWNKQSKYLQGFGGKYIIDTGRILHPKYSNIKEILEKLNLE